jgi:hypothetical protein
LGSAGRREHDASKGRVLVDKVSEVRGRSEGLLGNFKREKRVHGVVHGRTLKLVLGRQHCGLDSCMLAKP